MRITQQQFHQIQSALLDGYDRPGLRRMMRMGLDTSLDEVSAGTTDTQVVFDVIEWAERTDKVPELIAAAAEHNAQNELLQQLKRDAVAWFAPGGPSPAADTRPEGARAVTPQVPSAGGDFIIATIGAGAEDIVVGKNIQKSSGDSKARKGQ
jgi:hypothetical protein